MAYRLLTHVLPELFGLRCNLKLSVVCAKMLLSIELENSKGRAQIIGAPMANNFGGGSVLGLWS